MRLEKRQKSAWATVYIALGSNMGDSLAHLQAAVDALQAHPAVQGLRLSSVYQSAPIDVPAQHSSAEEVGDFLNAVLRAKTLLSPLALLKLLQSLEQQAGRIRLYPNAPRTLDMDILLYDDRRINEPPELIVPHPRMWQRAFVLYPLQELAAELVSEELLQSVCNQTCELMENVVLEV